MTTNLGYDHIQRGFLHWIVYGIAAVCLWAGLNIFDGTVTHGPGEVDPVLWLFLVMACLMVLLGLSFHYLRVRDRGDVLEINFGPLPLLRKQVSYGDIESVERARTSWIDGWGIHVVPGRGWTWNVWGRDCAKLRVNGSTLRLGSNDADELVSFIEERIGTRS